MPLSSILSPAAHPVISAATTANTIGRYIFLRFSILVSPPGASASPTSDARRVYRAAGQEDARLGRWTRNRVPWECRTPGIAIEVIVPASYTDQVYSSSTRRQRRVIRKRLLSGLVLVGAAMVFLAIVLRRRGSMSSPCPTCGRIDDLASVDPIGMLLDKAVLWQCTCGNTRAVLIGRHVPRTLIEKAFVRDAGSHPP